MLVDDQAGRGTPAPMPDGRWMVAALLLVGAGCAGSGVSEGPPLPDPAASALEARRATGVAEPSEVRFRWEYGDEGGRLRGDGVARVNPPDSFRLDLFTTGEGSMAVALTGDRLATLGRIEDVELPEPPFMYAMAGVFRPGPGAPVRGRRSDGGRVLVYEAGAGRTRSYRLDGGGRLVSLEERSDGRVVRRIELTWPETGRWPARAEYREFGAPRRVAWSLEEIRRTERFARDIYALGAGD